MAWQDEMIPILRTLVADTSGDGYVDATLKQTLAVAAYQVVQQLSFANEYVIRVSTQTISPDPTDDATKDDSFVNLVTQKAACIIDRGSAITAASQAIAVKDGSSAIDLRDVYKGKLSLLKQGWCAVYEDTKLEYQSGAYAIAGACVMTPFRTWVSGDCVPDRDRPFYPES